MQLAKSISMACNHRNLDMEHILVQEHLSKDELIQLPDADLGITSLIRIADNIGCTIDELTERTTERKDIMITQPSDKYALPPFYENFIRIVEAQQKDIYRVLACAGCQPTGFFLHNYQHGTMPTIKELVQIADTLNCTTDELLGRCPEHTTT